MFKKPRQKNKLALVSALALLIIFGFGLALPVKAQTPGQIFGTIFEDININNQLDFGENKLSGWQVDLIVKGQIVNSVLTNADGKYYFNDLVAGTYQLQVKTLNTWQPVLQNSVSINLTAGQAAEYNFSEYQIIKPVNQAGPMMQLHTVKIDQISPGSVQITWFTSQPATSQIVYGKNSKTGSQLVATDNQFGYLSATQTDFSVSTFHTVTLTNLEPEAIYYFRPISLPDPKQWFGAPRFLGDELTFATPKNEKSDDVKISPVKINKKISSVAFEEKNNLPTNLANPEIVVKQADNNQEVVVLGQKINSLMPVKNCLFWLWLLLVLDILAIGFIRTKDKKTRPTNQQKTWWLVGIFVLVPFAMGYPDCWLSAWLVLMLLFAIIYLILPKKKTPPVNFFGPAGNDALLESISSNKDLNSEKINNREQPPLSKSEN
ncbi:MAG: SdrD B-like domain-containing protein [Candidatus Buchananbacteria bacterium]